MRVRTVLCCALSILAVSCQNAPSKAFDGVGSRVVQDSLRSDQSLEQWIEVFLETAEESTPETRQALRDMAEAIETRLLKDEQLIALRQHCTSLRLRVLQLAAEYPENRKGNARRVQEALITLLKS